MALTVADFVLIGIMLISGLLALVRGFTAEVLSLLAWGGAAIAAYFLYPFLLPTAQAYLPEMEQGVVIFIVAVAIFIVALIIIKLLTMRINDWVLDSSIGVLDRTVGFVFGLARGLLLVTVCYLFFVWIVAREEHPDDVRNAMLRPLVDNTAEFIVSYLPLEIRENLTVKLDNDEAGSEPVEEDLPEEGNTDSTTEEGYDTDERSGLNQLLESNQDSEN